MDMDNSVRIDYGSGECDGQRRAKGENWDNCDRITIKNDLIKKEKKEKYIFFHYIPITDLKTL